MSELVIVVYSLCQSPSLRSSPCLRAFPYGFLHQLLAAAATAASNALPYVELWLQSWHVPVPLPGYMLFRFASILSLSLSLSLARSLSRSLNLFFHCSTVLVSECRARLCCGSTE